MEAILIDEKVEIPFQKFDSPHTLVQTVIDTVSVRFAGENLRLKFEGAAIKLGQEEYYLTWDLVNMRHKIQSRVPWSMQNKGPCVVVTYQHGRLFFKRYS
jgi:hypothetical protein